MFLDKNSKYSSYFERYLFIKCETHEPDICFKRTFVSFVFHLFFFFSLFVIFQNINLISTEIDVFHIHKIIIFILTDQHLSMHRI